MSIDDEFIQTIIANPDDDMPRLVYADWLDEQDNPRGEFIRIQCELAKMPQDDPRRWDMELRQGRLMRWYGWQWWHDPFAPDARRPTFRRGFPEEYELDINEIARRAAELFRVYPLFRFLTVHCLNQRDLIRLAAIPEFSRLHFLDIRVGSGWQSRGNVPYGECAALAQSPHLQSLKHLRVLATSFAPTGERVLRATFGGRVDLRWHNPPVAHAPGSLG